MRELDRAERGLSAISYMSNPASERNFYPQVRYAILIPFPTVRGLYWPRENIGICGALCMYRPALKRRTPVFLNFLSLSLFLACFVEFLYGVPYVQAQSVDASSVGLTRVQGPQDGDVAVPLGALPLGQKDAPALQFILDFLTAANGANWAGLQASGLLSATVGDTGVQAPASLTMQSGGFSRLDESFAEGQRSIRISGSSGAILESSGFIHTMTAAAAKGGLFAFSKLMDATFPGATSSVLDQGTVVVGGTTLHRITISEPAFDGDAPISMDQLSVVDLYFDPSTHLLIKSVASIQIDPADQAHYVQVLTYGDYRQVGTFILPYAYSQSLNGQPQWTLQLTSIQLGSSASSSFFQF